MLASLQDVQDFAILVESAIKYPSCMLRDADPMCSLFAGCSNERAGRLRPLNSGSRWAAEKKDFK